MHGLFMALYFMPSLSVLLLVGARQITAAWVDTSPITHPLPLWQARLFRTSHVALFWLMLAMPLLSWLNSIAARKPILTFFNWQLSIQLQVSQGLFKKLKDVHETIGISGHLLISINAIGALFHHSFLHDKTLTCMLPCRR